MAFTGGAPPLGLDLQKGGDPLAIHTNALVFDLYFRDNDAMKNLVITTQIDRDFKYGLNGWNFHGLFSYSNFKGAIATSSKAPTSSASLSHSLSSGEPDDLATPRGGIAPRQGTPGPGIP